MGNEPRPRLLPMTDWIGDYPVRHGERGRDLDPHHPGACLCGVPDYWLCLEPEDRLENMVLRRPDLPPPRTAKRGPTT